MIHQKFTFSFMTFMIIHPHNNFEIFIISYLHLLGLVLNILINKAAASLVTCFTAEMTSRWTHYILNTIHLYQWVHIIELLHRKTTSLKQICLWNDRACDKWVKLSVVDTCYWTKLNIWVTVQTPPPPPPPLQQQQP